MTDASSATSSSAASSAQLMVNGLISGINTPQVIQALLEGYQAPITNLQNEQTSLHSQASDYRTLNSDMSAVQTAAQALNTANSWNLMAATSSNTDVATATAAPGSQAGTLSFTVGALAQANVLLSSGGVASSAATVATSPSLLVSTGGAAIGFSALEAGTGLGLGSHAIHVTQSSAAASLTSSTLASSTTITSSNNTLNLSVNGQAYSLTLANGSYTPAQLVQAANSAATTANAPITATLSASGQLQLATNEQGSAATLSVTSGNAISSLGLTSGASATGTDAVVSVDGTATTITAVNAGGSVTLNAPSGTIDATIASLPGASGALISSGSAQSALVSTGNGSLSSVVDAINNAGLGVAATAITESSGNVRLQVAASGTGLAGSVEVDSSALGDLGTMSTITAAADASVSVGGANGYTLTSSTNSFTSLMPGSTVTVASLGTSTVTVSPDASGEASAVGSLVSAANQALSDISNLAGYNEQTKVAGPLLGSATVENLQQSILSAFAAAAGSSGLGSSSAVGITLSSTGTLSFNQSQFESAFEADPQKVASLFTAGGTYSPAQPSDAGDVSLVYAGNTTQQGSYAVSVSRSAAPALATGSTIASGMVSAGETLSINQDGSSTTYTTEAGQSLESIAGGLNSSFQAQGLTLSAYVTPANQLAIQSDSVGSISSFTVSSSAPGAGTTGLSGNTANSPVNYAGTDVAGTINGVAATGSGSILSAPLSDPTLAGLSLNVTVPGISSATNIGTYTYVAGLAQQLAAISTAASDPTTGSLTDEINGLTAQAQGLNSQIANDQALEANQQTLLQNEFANMETSLGQLKNESSALTSQLAQL